MLETIAASPGSYGGSFHGHIFSTLSVPTISDNGTVGFRPVVYTESDQGPQRVWTSTGPGAYTEIARQGAIAPGTDAKPFGNFRTLQMAGDGQSAFYGRIVGDGLDSSNDSGIWAANELGQVRAVGITGQDAPGTPYTFAPFLDFDSYFPTYHFSQSHSGQVAFWHQVLDPSDPLVVHQGIWAEDESKTLQLVALTGQPVPGYTDGTRFTHFSTDLPHMTDQGKIAFQAYTARPEDEHLGTEGIWRQNNDNSFRPVIRIGDSAPGVAPGAKFIDFVDFDTNSNGQTAVLASLDVLVDRRYQSGIWLANESGIAELVALEASPAPGVEGALFGKFPLRDRAVVLNGAGTTVFVGTLQGEGIIDTKNTGLWRRFSDGSVELIAREGESGPGGSLFRDFAGAGSTFASKTYVMLNSAGQVAFTSGANAIYAEDNRGVLQLVAQAGQVVDVDDGPGMDFRTIGSIHTLSFSGGEDGFANSFNDRGQFVFLANLENYGYGIFRANVNAVPEPGTLAMLAAVVLVCCTRSGRT